MKTLRNTDIYEKLFLGALLGAFFLRLAYATTRSIFESGPDAPFYAIAPLQMAEFGFWSSQIVDIPRYPSGYPTILWPFAVVFGSNWVLFVQIFQITLSVLTIWLVYKIVSLFLKREFAVVIGFLFLSNPAFLVMSGQAMYEPIFMFTFYAYLYLILKDFKTFPKLSRLVSAASLAGVTSVIHPRSIPWIVAIQLIIFHKMHFKRSMIFIGVFLLPVLFFLSRNGLVNGRWTLMSSVILDPYEKSDTLVEVVRNGVGNVVNFWSPFSGDAKRSTWYHNFTLYHEIKSITNLSSSVYIIAITLGVIAISSWLIGSLTLIKVEPIVGAIVLVIPVLTMGIDFFADGDSRHRLVIMPLLIIGQLWFWMIALQKIRAFKDSRRDKS